MRVGLLDQILDLPCSSVLLGYGARPRPRRRRRVPRPARRAASAAAAPTRAAAAPPRQRCRLPRRTPPGGAPLQQHTATTCTFDVKPFCRVQPGKTHLLAPTMNIKRKGVHCAWTCLYHCFHQSFNTVVAPEIEAKHGVRLKQTTSARVNTTHTNFVSVKSIWEIVWSAVDFGVSQRRSESEESRRQITNEGNSVCPPPSLTKRDEGVDERLATVDAETALVVQ